MNKLIKTAVGAGAVALLPMVAAAQISNLTTVGQTIITDAQVVAYFVAAISMIVAFAKYAHTREAQDARGAGIVCACALGIGLSVTILNTIINATGSSATMLSVPTSH